MAEQKEENERAVYKSTLEEIVEKILYNINKKNLQNKIVVKEGKSIGILTFKKAEQYKTRKLYAITMVVDGNIADYIYDEDGDNIAWVDATGNVITDSDIKIESDKLDEEEGRDIMVKQLNHSSGFQNDNQGRHITDKEEKIVSEHEMKQKKYDIEDKTQLTNWIDFNVSIDKDIAIIDLYRTIYNGRRLRDVLSLEKLKDRVPNGANLEHLNFLTVVNSTELTAKDGKLRESTVTCVIMDDPRNPKQMVELDTSILKPRADLSKQENMTADKTSEILGDGEIKKGATTTTNSRQITTFEIPDAEIGQSNDLITLAVRKNSNYIDKSTSQRNDAHNIEFYLGVQDKNKDENEQIHGKGTHSIKLEAFDETANIKEIEMQEKFRNFYGPDDEMENINSVKGMENDKVRDANEINQQMVKEEQDHINGVNKQYQNNGQATAEVANQVNERADYYSMAWDIIHDSDEYGARDLKYIYNLIMAKKAVMESQNEAINDEELKNRVQQDLENQRIPGDMTNPRRVG